ncbi:MAG: agmatine deiminase family protein [Bacteroidia bacterium]
MKKIITLIISIAFFTSALSQNLPHVLTPAESQLIPQYNALRNGYNSINAGIVTPPTSPVRTIGEWEELQGFTITWTSYTTMLREIVRNAKLETRVYIIVASTTERNNAINFLAAGSVDTVNVSFVITPYNSVWSRDYGMWSVYTNDVDSLLSVDWIYNRPRPKDDTAHYALANLLGTPLYKTTTWPWDLVNTGGNFMTDGFGTAFASKLILDDNLPAAGFNVNHTAAEIDTIMFHFMGINRYIKMEKLPYDQIHHIDMHIKLLDEQTLLVGQYPAGTADGPQIEANLQYVLNNFSSVYGTPYKVIRIPMPPDNGAYPPTSGADYYTYTNSSFINKTIIVPTYNIPQDTIALNIYRNALPGYKVVGINSTSSIGALGALHCITKEIGTSDPLLISHQSLEDTYDAVNPYTVNALMKHRSGIATPMMYYTTDTTQPYIAVAMTASAQPDWFTAQIPAQPVGTEIFYYVQATANSGKQQVRPIAAPIGYWHFHVLPPVGINEIASTKFEMQPAFPNPSKGITCIPASFSKSTHITVTLEDVTGKIIDKIFEGQSKQGEQKFFINTDNIAAGIYVIRMHGADASAVQKLVVR